MNNIEIQIMNAIKEQTMFDKMYQQYRIIDPTSHKILLYKDNGDKVEESRCYDIWSKNNVCDNCISIRASNEDDIFIKIELTDKQVFMITAIPIEIMDKKVVIELLKDVTNSMVIGSGDHQASIELMKKVNQLNLIAITDGLTNVYNKRYILEKLPIEIMRHRMENKPLSIIMTDLDSFKIVNDKYGHMAGDFILKEFTQILNKSIRDNTDWVSRFGGEEFLICLPSTEKTVALKIAERIRNEVENSQFLYDGQIIYLTASFGVSSLDDEIDEMEAFLQSVDKKLYKAKQGKKNRVVG